MLELNFYNLVLIPTICLLLYLVCSRLQKPAEYRNLSSHVPSVTKSFWSEMQLTWALSKLSHKDVLPFFMDMLKKNGPIVHFNISGKAYILLNDPDDIKVLLNSTQNLTKGPEYDMLKPWLNEGLLIHSGLKWQNRRKLLTHTFHIKTINMYSSSMNKHSRVLAEKLLEASANDNEISIWDYVTLCSLDMICETIMGCEMNSQDGNSREYVEAIKSACRSVVERSFKFWLWNDVIYRISSSGQSFYRAINVLHDFTDNVIKTKRTTLNNSKSQEVHPEDKRKVKSFLDLLLDISNEHPDQMTDNDIREEVDTFLFAGHDTSSISITMTLLLLGMYPDIQDRVREEIFSIFGNSDRDATIEDMTAMRYLEAVIKESLRIYPSVPANTRKLDTTLKLNNYNIPPETVIAIYSYIIHRNENIFPNPEEFIPERFLDEENRSKFMFAYLPFSAGPRNCIGQKYAMNQMKTVISTVLRKARIETLGTMKDIKIKFQIVIRIDSAPKMKFYAIS